MAASGDQLKQPTQVPVASSTEPCVPTIERTAVPAAAGLEAARWCAGAPLPGSIHMDPLMVSSFTRLTPPQAGPQRLLECRGPSSRLALLTSTFLILCDWHDGSSMASQLRLLAACPFLALALCFADLENITIASHEAQ